MAVPANLWVPPMRDPVETYMNLVPMFVEQTNRG